MQFDWKSLSTLDRVIVGGAAVTLISTFLPWYGVSVLGFSVSVNGWSAGASAWAGALLLTAAGVLLLLRRMGRTVPAVGGVDPSVLVAGVSALGLLLVIVRWLSLPSYHGSGGVGLDYSYGARYGLYVALIAGIAIVAAAVMEMRASGEQLPWAKSHAAAEPVEPAPEAPAAPEE